jgi:hypothetical protein
MVEAAKFRRDKIAQALDEGDRPIFDFLGRFLLRAEPQLRFEF